MGTRNKLNTQPVSSDLLHGIFMSMCGHFIDFLLHGAEIGSTNITIPSNIPIKNSTDSENSENLKLILNLSIYRS